jgi:hypothetical protein
MSLEQELKRLQAIAAIKEAFSLLSSKLPGNLLYHAYGHTEDVLREVVSLGLADDLAPRQIEILAVAAAWHDVGFIWSYTNNEPLAAEAAKSYLESCGTYTQSEIELIAQMIRDTALVAFGDSYKQIPSQPLSRYLLDADLANFGRADFFEKSELQRREINEEPQSFRRKTLALIKNHRWLTPAALARWQESKEENIRKLAGLLTSL